MTRDPDIPDSAGFTLVEMLAVVAILALAALVAVPLARPLGLRQQLEFASHELCSSLRATRARAIASNAVQDLVFDLANRTYESPAIAQKALPSALEINLVIANERRAGGRLGAIRFFPSGESSGGEIMLDLGGYGAHIIVAWLTGEAICAS